MVSSLRGSNGRWKLALLKKIFDDATTSGLFGEICVLSYQSD